MKRLIKICFILNYLFWSVFFLTSLGYLFAFNGLVNIYTFDCVVGENFQSVPKERKNGFNLKYSYRVGEEIFESSEVISNEIYEKYFKNSNQLEICYNKSIPNLSYIKVVNLAVRRHKVGLFVSLIFLVFFLTIDFFSNKNYWIKKYKEFFTRI